MEIAVRTRRPREAQDGVPLTQRRGHVMEAADADAAPAAAPTAAPTAAPAPVPAAPAALPGLPERQLVEFRRLFDLKCGELNTRSLFTEEQYEKVVHVLTHWEQWNGKQRKQEGGGNGHRWVKEYALHPAGDQLVLVYRRTVAEQSGAHDGDGGATLDAALEQEARVELVSHHGRVFDDLLESSPSSVSPRALIWAACTTILAQLSQDASFSAQPMDGRVGGMGAVAAHTSTVFCARTWLSQQLSHVSGPRSSVKH